MSLSSFSGRTLPSKRLVPFLGNALILRGRRGGSICSFWILTGPPRCLVLGKLLYEGTRGLCFLLGLRHFRASVFNFDCRSFFTRRGHRALRSANCFVGALGKNLDRTRAARELFHGVVRGSSLSVPPRQSGPSAFWRSRKQRALPSQEFRTGPYFESTNSRRNPPGLKSFAAECFADSAS